MPHSLEQQLADDSPRHSASASDAGLIFKTRVQESREVPQPAKPTAVTSDEPWWKWTERRIDYRLDAFGEAVGQALGTKAREVRETLQHEIELVKRESEQLRHDFNARVELEREREALREKSADAERARHESELASLRREVALLRGELGVDRGLRTLHGEIEAARAEIPKLGDIEARFDAELAEQKAEQDRLQRELRRTKDRVSRMRVDQSMADYRLTEHLREKPEPVVELKFECADSRFAVKDLHPDAAAAWRRFVAEMVEANDCTLSTNDPTGRVVALPSR